MIPLSDPDLTTRTRPYVTIFLIALNIAVFVYELTLGDLQQQVFFYQWGAIPAELTTGQELTYLRVSGRQLNIASPIFVWGTIVTSMFVHGGFLHIAGNMLYLWVFGDNVEDRLGHLGFLLFYLATGIAATWTQVALSADSRTPMIGASGAVAGVLGAYLLLYPKSRIRTLLWMGIFTRQMHIPAVFLLGFWFLLQFIGGVGSLGGGAGTTGGVAYWAHVGGFAAGLLAITIHTKLARKANP